MQPVSLLVSLFSLLMAHSSFPVETSVKIADCPKDFSWFLPSSSNLTLTAVSPGDTPLHNKVKQPAGLTGGMRRLWFLSPSGLWSGGCRSDQAAGTACPYLNLMAFLPLSPGASVNCVLSEETWGRSIRPCWTLKKCWSWLKRHIPSGDGPPSSKGM